MNLEANLLTVITFLPAVGAIILLFIPGRDARSESAVRWISLVVTLATFALSLWLWAAFDASNPGFQFVNNPTNPGIADEYKQGFAVLRSLTPDIALGSHPAMYRMQDKHARLAETPNPYIDPAGYEAELDAVETLFLDVLAEQEREAAASAEER